MDYDKPTVAGAGTGGHTTTLHKQQDKTSGLVTDGGTRTRPPTTPIDPHERFAGCLDNPDASLDGVCPRCGSERLDGWMTEGATSLYVVCVECGAETPVDKLPRSDAPEGSE
jgi:DNA-directed RNA polymerase subunit RPC12/RpoP